jgi:hypothetical protein
MGMALPSRWRFVFENGRKRPIQTIAATTQGLKVSPKRSSTARHARVACSG